MFLLGPEIEEFFQNNLYRACLDDIRTGPVYYQLGMKKRNAREVIMK
jgi:hypothetical protein